jgi:hypothetical protein
MMLESLDIMKKRSRKRRRKETPFNRQAVFTLSLESAASRGWVSGI